MARSSSGSPPRRLTPCLNCNFLVDLGVRDPRDPAAGFSEVILPELPVARPRSDAPAHRTLVLRRGFDGSPDLVDWWTAARRGDKSARRNVTVQLLAEDHQTVRLTWRFAAVWPVTLGYSPLSAAQPEVLVESIELTFDSAEVLGARGGTRSSAAPRAVRSRARARS